MYRYDAPAAGSHVRPPATYRPESLKRSRCLPNDVEYVFRLLQHRHVAVIELERRCPRALGRVALELRLYGLVVLADDRPAGLRPPGDALDLLHEEVRDRDHRGRPDELLLLLREIAGEALHAGFEQPDAALRDLDVPEHRRRWIFLLLALRRLVLVRSERSDVDEPTYSVVGAGVRDQRAAVRMADKQHRVTGAGDAAGNRSYVT